jgi:hypothetical protein
MGAADAYVYRPTVRQLKRYDVTHDRLDWATHRNRPCDNHVGLACKRRSRLLKGDPGSTWQSFSTFSC